MEPDPAIRVLLLAAGRLLDQAEPTANEAPPAIATAALGRQGRRFKSSHSDQHLPKVLDLNIGTIRGSDELTHERRSTRTHPTKAQKVMTVFDKKEEQ
jgi:hypothetical protein